MSLIQAVKAHALAHYEEGGWDVIVECWDDSQIATYLNEAQASTEAEAIASFAPLIDVWSDRQADARNEGYEW